MIYALTAESYIMKNFLLLLVLLPSVAFAAPYNPSCDYRDISKKCVSVKSSNFDIADKELNLIYKKVLSVLQKSEADNLGHATLLKPFIKSQKDWLTYRDSFCAFESELNVWNVSDDSPMYENKDCIAEQAFLRNKHLKLIIKKYTTDND